MEQELISIVVPVYRAERYIEETMDCVRAQTYPHWELLLVEDCGPDRSREIIEQYIRFLILDKLNDFLSLCIKRKKNKQYKYDIS